MSEMTENTDLLPEEWLLAYYGEAMNKVSFPTEDGGEELVACEWKEGTKKFLVVEVPLFTTAATILDEIEVGWTVDSIVPKFLRVIRSHDLRTLRFRFNGAIENGLFKDPDIESFFNRASEFYNCSINRRDDRAAIAFDNDPEIIGWLLQEIYPLSLVVQEGADLTKFLEEQRQLGETRYRFAHWTLHLNMDE